MRRFLILILLATSLTPACNNNDSKDTKKGDQNKKGAYTWSAGDQDEFFNDCKKITEQELQGEKLNEFCSCMVTEAQRHYRDYDQMNKEATEESDRKNFKECADTYLPDD